MGTRQDNEKPSDSLGEIKAKVGQVFKLWENAELDPEELLGHVKALVEADNRDRALRLARAGDHPLLLLVQFALDGLVLTGDGDRAAHEERAREALRKHWEQELRPGIEQDPQDGLLMSGVASLAERVSRDAQQKVEAGAEVLIRGLAPLVQRKNGR